MKKLVVVLAAVCPAAFMLLFVLALSLTKELGQRYFIMFPRLAADMAMGIVSALYIALFAKTLPRYQSARARTGAAIGIALAVAAVVIAAFTSLVPFLHKELYVVLFAGAICITGNVLFIMSRRPL